jgi:hypothetical protein
MAAPPVMVAPRTPTGGTAAHQRLHVANEAVGGSGPSLYRGPTRLRYFGIHTEMITSAADRDGLAFCMVLLAQLPNCETLSPWLSRHAAVATSFAVSIPPLLDATLPNRETAS